MPHSKQSRLQTLHESVTQRETRYLQVLNSHLPSQLSSVLENNFFTSIPLYTFLITLSLIASVFARSAETDLGKEAKKLATEAKQNFQEEKEELERHFSKVLEQAKEEYAQKSEEAGKKAEDVLSGVCTELSEVKKELVRAQDEITNQKADYASFNAAAKKSADESHVVISDLHYQIAEKDKKIRALESLQSHLEADLAKEKEMHESSKDGLHDAIEKLVEAKKHFTNGSGRRQA